MNKYDREEKKKEKRIEKKENEQIKRTKIYI